MDLRGAEALGGSDHIDTRVSNDEERPRQTMSFDDLDTIMREDMEEREQEPPDMTWQGRIRSLLEGSLNFYRVHLLVFIVVPFVFSGIFYACNTEYKIQYIDSLFVCVSGMTVTGLATINLSQISGWQQTIIFIQMLIGSPVAVSLIMITVRKHFFSKEFDHIIEMRRREQLESGASKSPFNRLRRMSQNLGNRAADGQEQEGEKQTAAQTLKRFFTRDTSAGNGTVPNNKDGSEDSSHNSSNQDIWTNEKANIEQHPPELTSIHNSGRNTPILKPEETRDRPAMSRAPTGWGWSRGEVKEAKKPKIRADMIKRVEGGGLGLVNPMGWYHSPSDAGLGIPIGSVPPLQGNVEPGPSILDNSTSNIVEADQSILLQPMIESPTSLGEAQSNADPKQSSQSPILAANIPASDAVPVEDKFPRTKTIAFDRLDEAPRTAYASGRDMYQQGSGQGHMPRTGTLRSTGVLGTSGQNNGLERTITGRRSLAAGYAVQKNFPNTVTQNSGYMPRTMTINQAAKTQHYGGFPTPLTLGKALFNKAFPSAGDKLKRSLTIHRTVTQGGTVGDGVSEMKPVDYITFDAVVGRNSHFHDLTKEEHDELGGVEYRALKILFWIVLAYYLGYQFIGFIIMAPYVTAKYMDTFLTAESTQYRYVPPYWFGAFQSVSAFSNTGMSLVDLSMLPYQRAYPMIFTIFVLIFAGNTAFPIFLRFTIWLLSKAVPSTSRIHETLKFLLDHPRRCFVYLFPSTQTWFLFLVMVSLTLTDWVCFLVLDIGSKDIEALPVGVRIADGFLQSAAVRAAGFAIVPLATLAPAVKVLYTVMQYISVYPIAMSIRSTNVYEERSLGVWNDEEESDEPEYQGDQAVAKYLGWHARRQLAFDIWWLAFALWLICIIERGQLNDTDKATWFTIFNIIFELVSAYGTVGLSLGLPYDNYSFCGSFSVLSKLVIIAVMIRGRHRGLPVAIDRAIMLPKDFALPPYEDDQDRLERKATRRASLTSVPNTGVSFPPSGRRESNFSAGHRRTSSGDGFPPAVPSSPLMSGRQSSERIQQSQSEVRLDRSPERPKPFSLGRANFDQNGLPRSLSTVQESGLSRAPTMNVAE